MKGSTVQRCSRITLATAVVGVIAVTAATLARPPILGSGCPRRGIYCLDVWDPVECIDRFGNPATYSNSCYAYVACATGCVPGNVR